MSIIDASSGYHNIKLDNQSSYLTMFACPFGRYIYKHLPFGAVPAGGNMFQCKINETFNDIPNVFGIADDILVIGYEKDGTDHNETVNKVLKCCRDLNLKLNKEKCHFRCTALPFFSEVVSRDGMQPDPRKISALTETPTPKNKKELQAYLGIINYLSKFSPDMVEVCKPLRKLTSSKAMWTWDASYQQRFEKAKTLIKVEMCMKFYDDNIPLYLVTDTSGISLRAVLLLLRYDTSCQTHMAPDNCYVRQCLSRVNTLTS